MKHVIRNCLIGIFIFIAALYLLIWLVLPPIINSKTVLSHILTVINSKTASELDANGACLAVSPLLNVYFTADKISAAKNGRVIFEGAQIEFYLPILHPSRAKISIDSLYYKVLKANNDKKTKSKLSLPEKFPEINIKSADIELDTGSKAFFNEIQMKDNTLSFDMEFNSIFLSAPITVCHEDKIKFTSAGITADSFRLIFKDSAAEISGQFTGAGCNYKVTGSNLPLYDIENTALLVLKQRSGKKNFIENFTDFVGKLDIDLTVNEAGISGTVVTKNLKAKTVPLSVPVFFKKLVFNFDKKDIFMDANGFLGNEPVNWTFYLTKMGSSEMEISGGVSFKLTNNFAKKYIDGLFIQGFAGLDVEYLVKNGVVSVVYSAEIPAGSDIVYNGSRLGLKDKIRSVHAISSKKGANIILTHYDYSVKTDNFDEQIIYGNADFSKKSGKYQMNRIWAKTMKDAPVSLLGFIENRLKDGVFNGDFEYDFDQNKFLGSIILQNSDFKGFKIINAAILGDKRVLSIIANGTYNGEAFACDIDLLNRLGSSLHIYNFEVFLKKYTMDSSFNKHKKRFSPPLVDDRIRITVDKFNLRLDEFIRNRIHLGNIALIGSVEDDILHFNMPSTLFAEGKLTAKGYVDFDKSFLSIDFGAQDIDADTAASQIFNLDNQFAGKAVANLHLQGPLKFNTVNGYGSFNIKEGALVNIGSTEFTIKRAKKKHPFKFSISDIIKVDKSLDAKPNSNISGKFDIVDEQIKNANLYVQNDSVSLFIDGDYNSKSGHSNLDIWGRYDSTLEQKISIVHIPLGWLLKFVFKVNQAKNTCIEKLCKIPAVKAGAAKEFNIGLTGNINNLKDLKIIFKRIN